MKNSRPAQPARAVALTIIYTLGPISWLKILGFLDYPQSVSAFMAAAVIAALVVIVGTGPFQVKKL